MFIRLRESSAGFAGFTDWFGWGASVTKGARKMPIWVYLIGFCVGWFVVCRVRGLIGSIFCDVPVSEVLADLLPLWRLLEAEIVAITVPQLQLPSIGIQADTKEAIEIDDKEIQTEPVAPVAVATVVVQTDLSLLNNADRDLLEGIQDKV